MKKLNKTLSILLLGVLAVCFLSAGYFTASAQDTAVLTMSGSNWSLKVDAQLPTALDSRNQPYVTVAKAGQEKELFLQLNSLKDAVAGQVQFKVETQGLTIYKQLPLTEEENKTGYIRPINVVNSFACYANGKKVMHIYASRLIDAKGNSVWVDNDLKDGLLTVYLDQKFLESAVFPVLVDPTFGYTSIGGSNYGGATETIRLQKYTLSVTSGYTATATKISYYTSTTGDSNLANVAIYNSTLQLVVQGTEKTITTADWYNYTISQTLTSGDYWLAMWYETGANQGLFYFDSAEMNSAYKVLSYTGTFPTDLSDATLETDVTKSIFVTYEETLNPTPTPSPTPAPTTLTTTSMTLVLGMADWTLLLTIVALVLTLFPKYHLANFIVGMFTIMLSLYLALTGTPLFAYWGTLFSVIIGIVCFLRGTDLI